MTLNLDQQRDKRKSTETKKRPPPLDHTTEAWAQPIRIISYLTHSIWGRVGWAAGLRAVIFSAIIRYRFCISTCLPRKSCTCWKYSKFDSEGSPTLKTMPRNSTCRWMSALTLAPLLRARVALAWVATYYAAKGGACYSLCGNRKRCNTCHDACVRTRACQMRVQRARFAHTCTCA